MSDKVRPGGRCLPTKTVKPSKHSNFQNFQPCRTFKPSGAHDHRPLDTFRCRCSNPTLEPKKLSAERFVPPESACPKLSAEISRVPSSNGQKLSAESFGPPTQPARNFQLTFLGCLSRTSENFQLKLLCLSTRAARIFPVKFLGLPSNGQHFQLKVLGLLPRPA